MRPSQPAPSICPLVPEGPLYLTAQQTGRLSRPEAAVTVETATSSWRLHWIPREAWSDWRPRVEDRRNRQVAALPPCRLVEEEAGVWIVAEMRGKRPEPWRGPPS